MQNAQGHNGVQAKRPTKLRLARQALGLKLKQASPLVNVSVSSLSVIERDPDITQLRTLRRIAAGYGVPVGDLIDDLDRVRYHNHATPAPEGSQS